MIVMTDIIVIINMNIAMMKLSVKTFYTEFLLLIHLYHDFLLNQKFLSPVYI